MTGWRWNALRAMFLVAITAGAWASLRGSWPDIVAVLSDIHVGRLLGALALTLLGLAITGQVWHLALATLSPIPHRGTAQSVFFVGQLGKYVPGSVWSFGAQAVLATRAGIASRAAVTASALYLVVHLSSGLILAGLFGGSLVLHPWMRVALVAAGAVALAPATLRRGGARLAASRCLWKGQTSVRGAALMVVAWGVYVGSLALLAGTATVSVLVALLASFTVAFAAGVLVPVAPAGLGAREVVFVAMLAPTLGAAPAAALAIAARLVQTVADLVAAGTAWLWARHAESR